MSEQYQTFELIKDLNGVILEIYEEDTYEVEFVDNDFYNYEYEGAGTFTIISDFIK